MTLLKSFRIEEETIKRLEEIAEDDKRTLNNLINKVLSDFIKQKGE